MFERFTDEARSVVVRAHERARQLGAQRIEPAHLLLAIATGTGRGEQLLAAAGIAPAALREAVARHADPLDGEALAALGVDLDRVRATAEAAFGPGALAHGGRVSGGHLPFADRSKRALEQSLRQAVRRGPRRGLRIDSGHVLFGLLTVEDPSVRRVLQQVGTDPETLRELAAGSDAA